MKVSVVTVDWLTWNFPLFVQRKLSHEREREKREINNCLDMYRINAIDGFMWDMLSIFLFVWINCKNMEMLLRRWKSSNEGGKSQIWVNERKLNGYINDTFEIQLTRKQDFAIHHRANIGIFATFIGSLETTQNRWHKILHCHFSISAEKIAAKETSFMQWDIIRVQLIDFEADFGPNGRLKKWWCMDVNRYE